MRYRVLHDRGEEGVTLLLVIGFMVLVGLVSAGLVTQLASSSKTRVALDQARNRQYSADGAILKDIAAVRSTMTNTNALKPCPGPPPSTTQYSAMTYGVAIQVDCSFSLLDFSGDVVRNATFTACLPQPGNAACPASAAIIKAQVHYSTPDPQPALNATTVSVDKIYIATWSVKA